MDKVILATGHYDFSVREVDLSEDNSLDSLQNLVGGLIEVVYINDGLILIINEEGMIKDFPITNMIYGTFFGPVVVCRSNPPDIVGLSEDDIKKITLLMG